MMMERVLCEKCNKEHALVFSYTKWLCGICFLKIKKVLDEDMNKRIGEI